MKIVAPVFSLLLMCSAQAAHASAITFEVQYTTLFNQTCLSHTGCFTLPNTPFTRTFTLDAAQLAIDGVYDVTASLDPSPIFTPAPGATFTISLVADAIVSAEHVIDLVIHFLETTEQNVGFGSPIQTTSSFEASSGTWSRATSTSDPFGLGGTSRASGTYIVQQVPVPEPGTLLLILGGGLLARLRTRHHAR
jgi:hypothetical protein